MIGAPVGNTRAANGPSARTSARSSCPRTVNGDLANATYGVLVASPSKAAWCQPVPPAEFGLERIGEARGERVGHAGRENWPHVTEEHLRDREEGGHR